MINKPLVTVFVCTYKKFELLEQALNSLYKQDYENIELIISDDASPNFDLDQINILIENKPKNIKNVLIIHHEKNLGTVKNLNNLLKVAKGEYYIGLSQDDLFYEESTITKIVDSFINTGALVITTKRILFNDVLNGNEKAIPSYKDYRYFLENDENLFYRLCISNFISGASTYHSKKLFELYGYFDEKYTLLEDYPKYLYLLRKKVGIYFLDEITKCYRLGGISTSKKINKVLLDDAKRTIELEIEPFVKEEKYIFNKVIKFNYEYYDLEKKLNLIFILKNLDAILYKLLVQSGFYRIKRSVNIVNRK